MPNDLLHSTLPPDLEAWVLDHLARIREPGTDGIEDVSEVACHPDGELVACTLTRRRDGEPTRHVAVVDLRTGAHRVLDEARESRGAAWSPDGRRLAVALSGRGAVVRTGEAAPGPAVDAAAPDAGETDTTETDATETDATETEIPTDGLVETCAWSPDGSRLALLVALAGAEISDVYGTGTVGATGGDWRPRVLPADDAPRRVVTVWSESGQVTVEADNVWEVAWAGPDALVAITSRGSGEGAWYAPRLDRLDLATGGVTPLLEPVHQLAQPRASPDGRHWSVLSGVQSDRGLPAGDLVVGDAEGHRVLDPGGIHVTGHHWLDGSTVLLTGLCGLRTAVARLDVSTGRTIKVWDGAETTGEYQPEVVGTLGRPPVVVLEAHDRPPTLGTLGIEGFRAVLAVGGPGAEHQAGVAGRTSTLEWTAGDGTTVQGLLTLPDAAGTDGPHPLVVAVHGGPVHSWRSTWSGRDPHATVLAARGYAVLRPNVRGSTGRGSAYVEEVRHDMGGGDVDDLLSGVRVLVDRGVADPARIGITGISYGGFLACLLPCVSDVFAAAVARSPVTDWVTQHLTSNIAEFDAAFLAGDLWDPDSQYRTRSPLALHEACTTPLLLTAGRQDLATPCSQAQVMHAALAERGVETALVVYPDEGHGVWRTETLADQLTRMLAWFERFMPPGGSDVSRGR